MRLCGVGFRQLRTCRRTGPGQLWADSVEKVLAAVGPNFLRAAGAFCAIRHDGPHQPEQNLSATFFFARRTPSQEKSEASKLLLEFCIGSIFDFFNRIGQNRTSLGSWTRSMVTGAGDIDLVARRCLLPNSGAYSCFHHAMRCMVARVCTRTPLWQKIAHQPRPNAANHDMLSFRSWDNVLSP
jgi:hypothetical protein